MRTGGEAASGELLERAQAIVDAIGGQAEDGAIYAAVLRSEWRIALEH